MTMKNIMMTATGQSPFVINAIGYYGVKFLQAGLLGEDHGAESKDIAEFVEGDALGRLIVAPGPARLLVEVLHGLGDGVMQHESYVRLVDTHAERDGSNHSLVFPGQPPLVDFAPGRRKNNELDGLWPVKCKTLAAA